jgi:ABC-type transport system involved in Fe-S cluster assembly fused permease/ATPase subunit
VNRYIGYGSLALVIGWLVLSYSNWLPAILRIGAPLAQFGPWFQQMTVAILLCFIAIQFWLCVSTWRIVQRRRQDNAQTATAHFSLSLFGELFWTALPLVLTIGLALAGYRLWASI